MQRRRRSSRRDNVISFKRIDRTPWQEKMLSFMAALPRRLMSFVLLIVAMTGMSLFSLAYRLLKWVLRFCFGLAGGGAILILAFYGLIYAVSPGKLKPDDWAALWNGESVMTVIFMGGLALYVAILFLETWLIRLAQPPLQRFWQWGFR